VTRGIEFHITIIIDFFFIAKRGLDNVIKKRRDLRGEKITSRGIRFLGIEMSGQLVDAGKSVPETVGGHNQEGLCVRN
jgi:hypothetical protein